MRHVIHLSEAPEYVKNELPFRTADYHLYAFHDVTGTYGIYSYGTCIAKEHSGSWKIVPAQNPYYKPHVLLINSIVK